MTDKDEQWLQDLVCGDASLEDAGIQQRLAADPALRQKLAELLEARAMLDLLGSNGGTTADEAAADPAAADRSLVAAALPATGVDRPRRGRLVLLLITAAAAATVLLLLLLHDPPLPGPDGPLGSAGTLSLDRDDAGWRLRIREPLPPGTSYHLRLEAADGTVLSATTAAETWEFPAEWRLLASRPGPHRLVVEVTDAAGFARRHSLRL